MALLEIKQGKKKTEIKFNLDTGCRAELHGDVTAQGVEINTSGDGCFKQKGNLDLRDSKIKAEDDSNIELEDEE